MLAHTEPRTPNTGHRFRCFERPTAAKDREAGEELAQLGGEKIIAAVDRSAQRPVDPVTLSDYRIAARLAPPSDLSAEVTMQVTPQVEGVRCVVFELSRNLKIRSVMSARMLMKRLITSPRLAGTARITAGM